jgi:hypothetical protein
MKEIAIRKTLSYFFTDSEEIKSCAFDEKLEKLHEEMVLLFEKYDISMGDTCTHFVGMEKFSICNCDSCGNLMMNRDKNPNGFGNDEIYCDYNYAVIDGGEHEAKILCEECLPIVHRWGLHS